MADDEDPRAIRSIAVTAEDVVTAYEATTRSGRETVLRITPPFRGRMRARLHVPQGEDDPAVHVPATDLVDESRLDPYPSPDETETAIREDPDVEYSTDLHHDRHLDAVRRWREGAIDAIVESVAIETPYGTHTVDVKVLGG